jgi:hypothetical protein
MIYFILKKKLNQDTFQELPAFLVTLLVKAARVQALANVLHVQLVITFKVYYLY